MYKVNTELKANRYFFVSKQTNKQKRSTLSGACTWVIIEFIGKHPKRMRTSQNSITNWICRIGGRNWQDEILLTSFQTQLAITCCWRCCLVVVSNHIRSMDFLVRSKRFSITHWIDDLLLFFRYINLGCDVSQRRLFKLHAILFRVQFFPKPTISFWNS